MRRSNVDVLISTRRMNVDAPVSTRRTTTTNVAAAQVFGSIDPLAMLSILHAMKHVIALPSELLTRQGRVGPAMMIIAQGRLSVTMHSTISAVTRHILHENLQSARDKVRRREDTVWPERQDLSSLNSDDEEEPSAKHPWPRQDLVS